MRPYLAIIKDSFREALASRVLWILLILNVLFLLALVPVGYREDVTTEFAQGDVIDPIRLVQKIRDESQGEEPSPGRRIWELWSDETKESLEPILNEQREGNRRSGRRETRAALNELVRNRELYDAEAWSQVSLGEETGELVDRPAEELDKVELARRNRLLLENAYPSEFELRTDRQVVITYFGLLSLTPPLSVPMDRVVTFISEIILPLLMSILVGFAAIFAAILVTSPIIPQMFETGTLSLLLSKPLSRSLMFLTKFAGGCIFVLINIALLNTGLWLILGARFGVWNQGLLLCIPIFLFMFAIYYAVSALSGAIWKNAIVSVVMAVLLWCGCFVVGTTKDIYEQVAIEPRRIIRVEPIENSGEPLEQVLVANQTAAMYSWNSEDTDWKEMLSGNGGSAPLGPVYDSKNQRVLASRSWRGGQLFDRPTLRIATPEDGWEAAEGPELPTGTVRLLPAHDGGVLAISKDDVFRISDNLLPSSEQSKKKTLFFFELPKLGGVPFESVGPAEKFQLQSPTDAALNRATGDIVLYSAGRLMLLLADEQGRYSLGPAQDVVDDVGLGAAVAFGGQVVLVALADGRVLHVDAESLEVVGEAKVDASTQPRSVSVARDGSEFAIVCHNGTVYTYRPEAVVTKSPIGESVVALRSLPLQRADLPHQGNISAVAYANDGHLYLAHDRTKISVYRRGSDEVLAQFDPRMPTYEAIYFYIIRPIHTVFPRPRELSNTVQYLLSEKETSDLGIIASDIEAARPRLDPWGPVQNSLIFMLLVLGIACVYVERQDF